MDHNGKQPNRFVPGFRVVWLLGQLVEIQLVAATGLQLVCNGCWMDTTQLHVLEWQETAAAESDLYAKHQLIPSINYIAWVLPAVFFARLNVHLYCMMLSKKINYMIAKYQLFKVVDFPYTCHQWLFSMCCTSQKRYSWFWSGSCVVLFSPM